MHGIKVISVINSMERAIPGLFGALFYVIGFWNDGGLTILPILFKNAWLLIFITNFNRVLAMKYFVLELTK